MSRHDTAVSDYLPLDRSSSSLKSGQISLSVERLALYAAIYFGVVSNAAFFRAVYATQSFTAPNSWLMVASLLLAIIALNTFLLCLLLNRWTAKPLLAGLLLVTAAAAYCMNEYTIYLDADMLRNVLHTDVKESYELFNLRFAATVVLFGGLPALLLLRIRIVNRPFLRASFMRGTWIAGSLAVAALAIVISFSSISSLMRNHKNLRYLVTPGNYLVSLVSIASDATSQRDQPRIPVGTDAIVASRPVGAKPRLLILIVGETVRAQNWGLNGYERQTTPQLSALPVINFPDVSACGSSTEISLPCMFSPYGRANYDKEQIRRSQSLLHVLDHAGVETLWRDNQTGCKGVCDGLPFETFRLQTDSLCEEGGCFDEILLSGLASQIENTAGDLVIVLHPLGNHGPAYYKRYPDKFRLFTPDCQSNDLGACSRAEIVNAYDNAILYADDFVARTIALLGQQRTHDSALIYVSDHGESLGEAGIYLHGIPYTIAPDVQLKVPMLVWLSERLVSNDGVDRTCVERRSRETASHDNLFHTALGLLHVQTALYDRGKDLLGDCTAIS